MDTQAGTSGVSRRKLVKGAAWAVPAVAVAVTSPAYAESKQVPGPPTITSVTQVSPCGTLVTWTAAPETAISGESKTFTIQYSVTSTSDWITLTTTTGTSYTISDPQIQGMARVRVIANNGAGASTPSAPAPVPTPITPAAPTLTVTGKRVTWPSVPYAASYDVETKKGGNNSWVAHLTNTATRDFTITDSEVKSVRVRSNSCGGGTHSSWVERGI